MKIKNASIRFLKSDFGILTVLSLVPFILHLICINAYGIFRDELYYIACSNHLAWGYVDQPPLAMVILRGIRFLFGDSLTALRIIPALSHSVFIFFIGWLIKEMGGKRLAISVGALAGLAVVGNWFMFHIYSMNFWDSLIWLGLVLILIRLIKTQNTRLWLLFGLIAGLGLQNKISILFLIFGIIIGLIATSERRQLKSGHFWIGMILAGLLFLPYIIWNSDNDWAAMEFIHNAKTQKMADVNPFQFFIGQLLYQNPATFFIWFSGLLALLFWKSLKPFRLFGCFFLSIYVLFTVQEAKDYYLASAYPILFASGALFWEHLFKKGKMKWLKPIVILGILIPTILLVPITLPILPVEVTIDHIQTLGIQPKSGERIELETLPQHFADMHGWNVFARTFGEVYQSLPPEEQDSCWIFVRNYGEAGAIDFYGHQWGLPRATCAHNNYWIWGPQPWNGKTALILMWSRDKAENRRDLESHFEYVEHAATFQCKYCMPYENNHQIYLCKRAKGGITELEAFWRDEKHYQ